MRDAKALGNSRKGDADEDSSYRRRHRGAHQPGAPADAAQPTQEELREWCRGQLARYKVPREFIMVPDLGRDGLGKLRRRAVAERFL